MAANRQSAAVSLVLFVAVGCLVGLAAWAYAPAFRFVVSAWISSPDYSHGFLVVPISVVILWARRAAAPPPTPGPHWGGLVLVALAALAHLIAGRIYLPELDAWSIPVWIAGLVWLAFGFPTLRWAAPSIGFLWFATPLPGTVETALGAPLQSMAAALAAGALRVVGQPALAEGTTILVDHHVLDVERACSGLRMFYGIVALSYAWVAITRPNAWKAAFVLVAAAPIAVIANVVRITLAGVLLRHFNSDSAQQAHDLAALVMIPVALALLVCAHGAVNQASSRMSASPRRAATWLARWGAAGAAVTVALLVWANHRQDRALKTLVDASERLEAKEDLWGAIEHLGRYVAARPHDAEAHAHFAQLYAKAAESPADKLRALAATRAAWQVRPHRHDLGLQAARLGYEAGEHETAAELCDRLLSGAAPGDVRAAAIKLKADSLYASMDAEILPGHEKWRATFDALDAAARLPNADARHSLLCAEVYRDRFLHPLPEARRARADAWMDELVGQRPDDAEAWLARYVYRRRHADYHGGQPPDDADDDLRRALEAARRTDSDELLSALLTAASRRAEVRDLSGAARLLREAIDASPGDYRAYAALAAIRRQEGTSEALADAVAAYRQGVAACGEGELRLTLPLASLLAEAGEVDEAQTLAAPAQELLARVAGPERSMLAMELALVRTRILTTRDGPSAGARWLEQLLADHDIQQAQSRWPSSAARLWGLLGQLYLQVGAPDQAVGAFENSARLDPDDAAWRTPVALASLEVGRLDAADQELRVVASGRADNVNARLALAQVELARQSQRPKGERTWRRFYELMTRAERNGAPRDGIALLDAQARAAQGDAAGSREALRGAAARSPGHAPLWRALALACDAAGDAQGAWAAADKFAQLAEAPAAGVTLRATLLAKHGRAPEAQKLMADAIAKANGAARLDLSLALAGLLIAQGEAAAASDVLTDAHRHAPRNLQPIDALASLALLEKDWPAHERCEAMLRGVEGEGGSLWRAHRAERLMLTAEAPEDPKFRESASLIAALQSQRPNWWRANYLSGELELRRGREAAALAAFQRAWGADGRDMKVADRLIDLLSRKGRLNEAQEVVEQLGGMVTHSRKLFDRVAPLWVRSGRGAEAIEVAQQWADSRPDDARSMVRVGRVLALVAGTANEPERTENVQRAASAFRQAIQTRPDDLHSWATAVTSLRRAPGGRPKALQLVRDLQQEQSIDDLARASAAAQLYEQLDMIGDAQACYLAASALAAGADDQRLAATVLTSTARFYLAKSPALAAHFARQALAARPSSRAAKKVLVLALERQEGAHALGEALGLLSELNGDSSDDTLDPFQKRARAALLARRKGPGDLERAVSLLEGLLDKTPDDRLRLARLYEEGGRIGPALGLLDQLARSSPPRPADLTEFLRFWQENFVRPASRDGGPPPFASRAREVYRRLGQMSRERHEQLRWELREIKARGQVSAITADVARPFVDAMRDQIGQTEHPRQRMQRFSAMLGVLLDEDAPEAAIHATASPPRGIDGAEALIRLCAAVIAERPSPAACAAAERYVASSAAEATPDANVLHALGDLRYMLGDYAGATDAYRQALSVDSARPLTMNNLALALAAQRGKRNQASRVLDRALLSSPDNASLWDTKAVLALIDDQPGDAMEVLLRVAPQSKNDPLHHLHVALAHQMLGEAHGAQQSFYRAVGLGVDSLPLGAWDQSALEQLRERQLPDARPRVRQSRTPGADPI